LHPAPSFVKSRTSLSLSHKLIEVLDQSSIQTTDSPWLWQYLVPWLASVRGSTEQSWWRTNLTDGPSDHAIPGQDRSFSWMSRFRSPWCVCLGPCVLATPPSKPEAFVMAPIQTKQQLQQAAPTHEFPSQPHGQALIPARPPSPSLIISKVLPQPKANRPWPHPIRNSPMCLLPGSILPSRNSTPLAPWLSHGVNINSKFLNINNMYVA
jgi:hypothetical protein